MYTGVYRRITFCKPLRAHCFWGIFEWYKCCLLLWKSRYSRKWVSFAFLGQSQCAKGRQATVGPCMALCGPTAADVDLMVFCALGLWSGLLCVAGKVTGWHDVLWYLHMCCSLKVGPFRVLTPSPLLTILFGGKDVWSSWAHDDLSLAVGPW